MTFLVINGSDVRIMNVNGTSASSDSAIVSTISDLVDKSPSIIAKIKSFFKKDEEVVAAENTEAEPLADSDAK